MVAAMVATVTIMSTLSIAEAKDVASAQDGASTSSALAAVQDYRLGPGDQVQLTVYDDKELSGQFYVSSTGTISLPLVGEVNVAGITIHELEALITAKLADGFILNPKVSAEVLIYRPFYILGEVNKPGEYPYTSGLTALRAVAVAAGFTYRANSHRVFIRHANDPVEHEYKLNGEVYIQPGDVVRISERHF